MYDKSKQAQLNYLQLSFKEHEKIITLVKEYKHEKKMTNDNELPKGMQEQYRMCLEMYELLPIKLSKLQAALNS